MEAKGFISLIIGITGIILSIFIKNHEISGNFFKISIGLILASFIEVCVNLFENRGRIRIIICTWLIKPNKPIRITTAYLFRIEIRLCKSKILLFAKNIFLSGSSARDPANNYNVRDYKT